MSMKTIDLYDLLTANELSEVTDILLEALAREKGITPEIFEIITKIEYVGNEFDEVDVEQCIIEGNDYKDCVDRMVETMKSPVELENVTNEWYDKEGNLKQ